MITTRPLTSKPTHGPRSVLKVLCGFALLLAGAVLALPGVPGPGIALLLVGLWLLSDHFTWAKRAFGWIKERAKRFQPTGNERRRATEDGQWRA
jgi:hypothetical protein